MSPRALIPVCLAAAMLYGTIAPVAAAQYFVRKGGNDRLSGTSRTTAWQTLTRLSQQPLQPEDIVYVGAGLYREPFTPSGGGTARRPARIFGDTRGQYTGDRGAVVFTPSARRWHTTLNNTGSLRFDNVTFDSRTTSVGNQGHGIYTPRGTMPIQFVNCVFQQLRYGAWSSSPAVHFYNCRFQSNTAVDVYLRGQATALLRACSVDHTQGNGNGVFLTQQSAATLDQCRFTSGRFGVYSNGSTRISVAQCIFNKTQFPVYGRAQSAEVSGSAVSGARTGISIAATGQPAQIQNVRVSASNTGLQVPATGYRMSGVTLDRNRIALLLHSQLPRFEVQKSTQLTLQRNQYGVYLPRSGRSAGTDVVLRGMTFSGHSHYAVLTNDADLSVRDCRFDGNRYGVYAASSRSCEIRDTQFDRHTSGWAVVATGHDIDIRDCNLTGNRNAIYLRPAAGQSPVVRSLAISDSRIGIRVDGASFRLPASSGISVTGTTTGLMLIGTDADLNDVTLSGGSVGIDIRRGTAVLKDVAVSDSGYGVYARNVNSLSIDGLVSRNNRNWGLYGTGQSLQVTRSAIESNRNGIYLQETGGDRAVPVSGTRVTDNSGYGLLLAQCTIAAEPDLSLFVRNNAGTGIAVMGPPLQLTSTKKLEISRNGTGIYSGGGSVTLAGVKLADNSFGVRARGGDVNCTDVSISGGNYGIYQTNAAVCELKDSQISDARLYGLVVSNAQKAKQRVSLSNVKLLQNRTAAYVNSLADGRLTVAGCDLSSNSGHGLLSYRAESMISQSTISSNGGYGIIHIDGPLSATGSTLDGNGSYAVRVYSQRNPAGTRLGLQSNQFRDNQIGVGMLRVNSAEIVNNVIAGSRYGIISHTSGSSASVWNNTLADNQIGIYHSGGQAVVANNVISYGDLKDADREAWGIYFRGGTLEHRHNLLFGQTRKYLRTKPGIGDVIKPPRFRDYAAGDFRLAMGSPAINAGAQTELVSDDANGLSRPLHGATEIGAYEFQEGAGSVRILDWQELPAGGS